MGMLVFSLINAILAANPDATTITSQGIPDVLSKDSNDKIQPKLIDENGTEKTERNSEDNTVEEILDIAAEQVGATPKVSVTESTPIKVTKSEDPEDVEKSEDDGTPKDDGTPEDPEQTPKDDEKSVVPGLTEKDAEAE